MDLNTIIQVMLIFLVSGHYVSPLNLQTEENILITQEDKSINLNCTYQMENEKEEIRERDIIWRKQIDNIFQDIAVFSPPEGVKPYIVRELKDSYGNRTDLIAPNITLSAVLIIKDPVCSDDGIYQCLIKYFYSDSSEKKITSLSTVVFYAKARQPDEFIVFPIEVTENQSLSLICSADVGTPQGYIQIWKFVQYSNTTELINTSESTTNPAVNCMSLNVTVNATYTVTRHDNGAQFRCSSQNNLTQGTGPIMHSSKISVKYGPSSTRIKASFSNSHASIGERVTMDCISDGNPFPNFTWTFNVTEIVSDGKYSFSVNRSRLSFTITNITDSGHYQCVASNIINGKSFNSSSSVTLRVQEKNNEPSYIEQTCSENPCLIIENCVLTNGKENCVVNIWTVIAFPFIALTLILCTTTFSLGISRIKQQKKDNTKKGFHIDDVQVSYTRETFEDFGGYADPKDVKKPENGKIKSDREVRDNPYADPVDFQTQYAVVQKNLETPASSTNDKNSSNPSHLLNNTDAPTAGNPSSPPKTINPNNEKTPDSTETSETIPKPPNVYDDAWV